MENSKLFSELYNVDINGYVEKKKDLSYLNWAYCIKVISEKYDDFEYEVERFNGFPYLYDALTGYMVFTKVKINGITKEMFLPVMDGNNKAMKSEAYEYETKNGVKRVEAATMFDINKTIMRCLVKNIAMFGLGLKLYIGCDDSVTPENFETKTVNKENEGGDGINVNGVIYLVKKNRTTGEVFAVRADGSNGDSYYPKYANANTPELFNFIMSQYNG